jgi:hypothetical protein
MDMPQYRILRRDSASASGRVAVVDDDSGSSESVQDDDDDDNENDSDSFESPTDDFPDAKVAWRIEGLDELVDETDASASQDGSLAVYCRSTYPHIPGRAKREGDPIADTYVAAKLTNGHVVLALADGCNWGKKSKGAALRACNAFASYVLRAAMRMRDTVEAGHFLLRGFARAHQSIVQDFQDNVWDAGTTCLLGGLLVRLDPADVRDKANSAHAAPWVFLACSVGDVKSFIYSKHADQCCDVTAGNRFNVNDSTDPGGRLGPHCDPGGQPDLRNLRLHYVPCYPGDLIAVCSDGVYDNYDPEQLAIKPGELGVVGVDDWTPASTPDEARAKNTYVEEHLRTDAFYPDGTIATPRQVARRLIQYALDTTEPSREWLMANPRKRLPSDYERFKGKLDHASCIVLRVPDLDDSELADVAASSSSSSSSSAAAPSSSQTPSLSITAAAATPSSSHSKRSPRSSKRSPRRRKIAHDAAPVQPGLDPSISDSCSSIIDASDDDDE